MRRGATCSRVSRLLVAVGDSMFARAAIQAQVLCLAPSLLSISNPTIRPYQTFLLQRGDLGCVGISRRRRRVGGAGVVGVGGGIGVVVVASFALILAFVVVGRIRGRVGSGSVR